MLANLANNGGIDAQQVTVQLWLKDAQGARTLVAQNTPVTTVGAGCSTLPITLQWLPKGFTSGLYTLSLEVQASNVSQEANTSDNVAQQAFWLLDKPLDNVVHLPFVER